MTPFNRQALRIPPDSFRAWLRLALWELWMGMVVCGFLGFGALLIVSSRGQIVTSEDLTDCYASSPIAGQPCERIVYRGGMLNVAFTVLCGVLLIGVAAWFLWELWSAVEPQPITDDFLKLLHDSFGHDWRDPRTWPWSRLLWAYGFTLVGATLTAGAALIIWTLIASSSSAKAPTIHIDTSQSFRLDQ